MQTAISALILIYGLLVGLWPLVWLFAIVREGIARRWPVVTRLLLLIPLWTVAVSVGGLQVGTLWDAATATEPSPRPLVAATSLAVALCFAVVAWMLLRRLMLGDRGRAAHRADRDLSTPRRSSRSVL